MQALSVAAPPLRMLLAYGVFTFHVVLLGGPGVRSQLWDLFDILFAVAFPAISLAMTLGLAGVCWMFIEMGGYD